MFNDFTHYLIDPIHGDQEEQFENRRVVGGTAKFTLPMSLGSIDNEFAVGVLTRYDSLGLGRLPSQAQVRLSAHQPRPPSHLRPPRPLRQMQQSAHPQRLPAHLLRLRTQHLPLHQMRLSAFLQRLPARLLRLLSQHLPLYQMQPSARLQRLPVHPLLQPLFTRLSHQRDIRNRQ